MRSLLQQFDVQFRYPIHFTSNLFAENNPLLADVVAGAAGDLPTAVLFIVDQGVQRCNPSLLTSIERYCSGFSAVLSSAGPALLLPGGEEVKNDLRYVDAIHREIDAAALCRHSFVVGVGGGALLDAVGFATSGAHRGIRLIRVPTTVLAQNDSAIGVKNGVNLFGKKNWLGSFTPPYAVLNDSQFLRTLSDRDWCAGIAEAVKIALVKDADFFDFIEAQAPALAQRNGAAMDELIYRCARHHMDHIADNGDPFEQSSSRPLDFGHWSAHKLEQLTDFRLRHGEAVAIGIALDTTYSWLSGLLDESVWQRVLTTLTRVGFRLFAPELTQRVSGPDSPLQLICGLDEFQQHLGGRLTVTLLLDVGRGVDVHAMDQRRIEQCVALLEAADTHSEATRSRTG